jgi:hypothetical protein
MAEEPSGELVYMCVCIYVCMKCICLYVFGVCIGYGGRNWYVCMHVCMKCIYACMYEMHLCLYVCMSACAVGCGGRAFRRAGMYMCMYVCMCVCVFGILYVRTFVCVCIRMVMCMHAYIPEIYKHPCTHKGGWCSQSNWKRLFVRICVCTDISLYGHKYMNTHAHIKVAGALNLIGGDCLYGYWFVRI